METKSEFSRLVANLSRLGLTKVADALPAYMADPSSASKPAVQVMRELTDAEIEFRDRRAAESNVVLSHFPCRKDLDSFDFSYQPSVSRDQVMELKTLRFVEDCSNVLLIGSSGVGKTHIAIALGIEASRSRVPTYFIHFRDLVVRLRRALAEGREESTIKNLNRYRLLVIDEVGYFPVDKAVAGLIFQLVAMRYEKKSIIVTTNQPLSKWGEVFADPVIASAIVDRLVHHSTIIRITGVSYRIKGKLDEAGEGPAAADPLGGPHRKRGRPRKAASQLGPT